MARLMGNVLVTGGAGYIGSHTTKLLSRNGYRPIVLDNLSSGHRWAVRGHFVQGTLADYDLLCDVLSTYRIDSVIHFAANAYVGESMDRPEKYFQNNVVNSLTLLQAMLAKRVKRIVFSSSCTVYGEPRVLPLSEEHPQNPTNPYGDSKLFVEKVLRWYAIAHGLQSVALRYFNAAGADPEGDLGEVHDPETHLIPLAIETALNVRPALEIYGTDYQTPDGTAIRDYVHVCDLALAHLRALEYLDGGGPSAAFNLGTGQGHSVKDVIKTVERVSGRRVRLNERARRPGDPPMLVASADKAREELGWEPHYVTLDSIVETAWAWHSRATERLRTAAV